MKNLQAYVFLTLGAVLNLLPLMAPAQFPANSLDGSNTSALWLQFMGWVIGGIGTGYLLLLEVLPSVAQLLAWRPSPLPDLLSGNVLRPTLQLVAGEYENQGSGQGVAA